MKENPVNKQSPDYKEGYAEGYNLGYKEGHNDIVETELSDTEAYNRGYEDGLKALKEQLGNDWVYKLGYLEGVDVGREFQETAKALEKPTKGKPEPVDDVDDPELLAEIDEMIAVYGSEEYKQGYIEGWVSCKAEVLNRIAKLDTKDELA